MPVPKLPQSKRSPSPSKSKKLSMPLDEWVAKMAKKFSEAELQHLEKKYPKAVHAVRLTQLQQRHMDPDQFAVRMAKLRQQSAPKGTLEM